MSDDEVATCIECWFLMEPGEESDRDPRVCVTCAAALHRYELE